MAKHTIHPKETGFWHIPQAAAWHYMHEIQFKVDFSTAKFCQHLDCPELITMNLLAELSGLVQKQGATVLTDTLTDASSKSDMDFHLISWVHLNGRLPPVEL